MAEQAEFTNAQNMARSGASAAEVDSILRNLADLGCLVRDFKRDVERCMASQKFDADAPQQENR